MATWIELCWRYPDLPIIVSEAAGCANWTKRGVYCARVRALGMSPVEEALAMGVLLVAHQFDRYRRLRGMEIDG